MGSYIFIPVRESQELKTWFFLLTVKYISIYVNIPINIYIYIYIYIYLCVYICVCVCISFLLFQRLLWQNCHLAIWTTCHQLEFDLMNNSIYFTSISLILINTHGSFLHGQIWMLTAYWKKPRGGGYGQMKFMQYFVTTLFSPSMSSQWICLQVTTY